MPEQQTRTTDNQPEAQHVSTLLVVDDEPGVVDAVCETLYGDPAYRILSTTDPFRALEILKGKDRVDLLITDLFMPEMDGPSLLTAGRSTRPDLLAVFTTGMASDHQLRQWRSQGQPIVAKPWTERELRDAIGKSLMRVHALKGRQSP